MVNNHYRPGFSLRRRCISRHYCFFLGIFLMTIAWINCGTKTKDGVHVPLNTQDVRFSRWDEVFDYQGVVRFSFDDPEQEIYTIGGLLTSPKGDYFISDWKAKKIMRFNGEGKFLQSIGSHGEGPGEHDTAAGEFIDGAFNLYIFDVGKNRLIKYDFPGYDFDKNFLVPSSLQYAIPDDKGNFIIYTVTEPYILYRIDREGKVIDKAFNVGNEPFRIFSARFQLGSLSAVPGNLFLLSYPEEYKIYLFDYQFNLKKVFYADHDSKYFPGKAVFPGTLSPYDFSPKHSKWWGEALRPARVFYLGNGLFIQELFQFTNLSARDYVNLHDLDGKTYAAGLEVPFGGIIRFVKDGYVYVVEDSKFDEKNNVIPLKLHRFRLKDKLSQGY